MKKAIAIFVAASMMLSALTACSNTSSNGGATETKPETKTEAKTETKTESTESESGGEVASEYDKKITIAMNVLDAEKHGGTARNDYLNSKFNVEWQYIPVTWGDWTEKVRAWIAADDMPDILWWDMKLNHTAEFRAWANQGAFREIPNDPGRWPELAKQRESLVSDDKVLTVDGKLYGWPAGRNNPDWLKNAYYSMMVYRRDWAKEVGLYKEGDVYTWDEVKTMIETIREKDPGGNGANNTFGITSESWSFPGEFMEILGGVEYLGGYYKRDGKYVAAIAQPEFIPVLEFATNLYRDGYIWKDQMVVGGSEGADNFFAGRSAFYLGNPGPGWFNGSAYKKMLDAGVIKSTDDIAPVIVLSPFDNKTFWLTQTEDYWTVSHINHKVDDEKMNRILDIWNWALSDEGKLFVTAGIPGQDYEIGSDGTPKVLWEKDAEGAYISPYFDKAMNEMTPPALLAGPTITERMEGYDAFKDVFKFIQESPDYRIHPLDWDVNTFSAPNYDQYGSYSADVKAKVTEIFSSKDDVKTAWEEFLKEMNPKLQPIIDELNEGLK